MHLCQRFIFIIFSQLHYPMNHKSHNQYNPKYNIFLLFLICFCFPPSSEYIYISYTYLLFFLLFTEMLSVLYLCTNFAWKNFKNWRWFTHVWLCFIITIISVIFGRDRSICKLTQLILWSCFQYIYKFIRITHLLFFLFKISFFNKYIDYLWDNFCF